MLLAKYKTRNAFCGFTKPISWLPQWLYIAWHLTVRKSRMKTLASAFVALLLLPCLWQGAVAQSSKDYTVLVHAMAITEPTPRIVLTWDADTAATMVTIQRKLFSEPLFGPSLADITDGATSWTDTTIREGDLYEYRLLKTCSPRSSGAMGHIGSGYCAAAVGGLLPPRGPALLLVDETVLGDISEDVDTLVSDLRREGWTTILRRVPRAETFSSTAVESVRALIRSEHAATPLGAIILLGRVPVPYSGNVAPDAHIPDHQGAWPCDGCYADVDGIYTDESVNTVNNDRPVQSNVPGDGKWDNSTFATAVDVAIGRIDFANMPAFGSEVEALRRYLRKNHAWRTAGRDTTVAAAIIDDNFAASAYPEAFAASGWRSFAPMTAAAVRSDIRAGDFFDDQASGRPHLFAYGCGPGSDASAGGVGSTADFASKPVHAVFTMLFGSYFGDWDTRNNFLRASLASDPHILTTAWSGRPHWYLHRMAMGETIGEAARLSMNATWNVGGQLGAYLPNGLMSPQGLRISGVGDRGIHIALMGDPTLRLAYGKVGALGDLDGSISSGTVSLRWSPPVGGADAYAVFRQRGANPNFIRVTERPITDTTFTETVTFTGTIRYRVVPYTLVQGIGGTFYEAGTPGTVPITITSTTEESLPLASIVVAPNPATETSRVTILGNVDGPVRIRLMDATGNTVQEYLAVDVTDGVGGFWLPVQHCASGMYTIILDTPKGSVRQQIAVVR